MMFFSMNNFEVLEMNKLEFIDGGINCDYVETTIATGEGAIAGGVLGGAINANISDNAYGKNILLAHLLV